MQGARRYAGSQRVAEHRWKIERSMRAVTRQGVLLQRLRHRLYHNENQWELRLCGRQREVARAAFLHRHRKRTST